MRVRPRRIENAEQWDGSDVDAPRLGLVQLRMASAPSYHAWHLPTFDGPVLMRTGDWIVSSQLGRTRVPAETFWSLYEDVP